MKTEKIAKKTPETILNKQKTPPIINPGLIKSQPTFAKRSFFNACNIKYG